VVCHSFGQKISLVCHARVDDGSVSRIILYLFFGLSTHDACCGHNIWYMTKHQTDDGDGDGDADADTNKSIVEALKTSPPSSNTTYYETPGLVAK
jgi:hypothetical protein